MSGRDIDLDDLFDRDADSRLLERRRREELGLAPHRPATSSTPPRFGAESMLADESPPASRSAVLRVAVVARPNRELIPGAVVTVVVTVHDDGHAAADNVDLRITLPAEAEAIAGSFARDEIEIDGEALLGPGLLLGTVEAGEEVRIRFAFRVLPGTGPLDLGVHAGAPGVPTISAPAQRLMRRSGHASVAETRPFFELEAGEADDELRAIVAAGATPQRAVDAFVDEPIVVPIVIEAEREPELEPFAIEREPEIVAVVETEIVEVVETEIVAVELVQEPAPVAAAPAPEPEPQPESEPAPPPRAREFALLRNLEVDEVRALEHVFAGDVPHGLAGLALLSSIAAVDAPLGAALGVRDFARSVAAALPRALVAARLQHATTPVVTRAALASIRPYALAPAGDVGGEGALLALRLDERGLDGLRAVLGRDLDDIFLRGVQVLLAVCPRSLEGVDARAAERAGEALAQYRVAAGAWLMRVTVRRAVDRAYDPLTADDRLLHEAGRALVGVLRDAMM
jgi:hypothetical protein